MKKNVHWYLCLLVVSMFASLTNSSAYASENDIKQHSTVILMYHHVSSDTPPSTSISPENFKAHIEYVSANFNVISLAEAINAFKNKKTLPPNTLVITFDDGYRNILENGHPILQKYKFPYTIFINPERIGVERGQLDWEEVLRMQSEDVTFANHTMDHLHLLNKLPGESENEWLQRVWSNIDTAQQQLVTKLGPTPKWLAYPFGEYNEALANKLVKEGYTSFGQHSGGFSVLSNFSAIPRFPAAGIYANLSSLKTKMYSFAMPVNDFSPKDPERKPGDKLALSFTVAEPYAEDVRISQLQCFYKGEAIPHSLNGNTLSVKSDKTLPIGRSRVNCTAPSNSQAGRYYWYSQPFFVANKDGIYPD